MLLELNEAIKKLLDESIKDYVRGSGDRINIDFTSLDKELIGSLADPTINICLYDIREDLELRHYQPNYKGGMLAHGGKGVAFSYLITVWSKDLDKEQYLLSLLIKDLIYRPYIPEKYLSSQLLAEIKLPPKILALQPSHLHGPGELWSVIGSKLKSMIHLTITVPIDPEAKIVPPVKKISVEPLSLKKLDLIGKIFVKETGSSERLAEDIDITVILTKKSLSRNRQQDQEEEIAQAYAKGGRFSIKLKNITTGTYFLIATAINFVSDEFEFTITEQDADHLAFQVQLSGSIQG